MKLLILYRPKSPQARKVEEFTHDFKRQYPDKSLELEDIDTRDGSATASLYDLMSQPAVLALKDDGQVVQSWVGDQMPMMNEIAYYANL